MGKITPVQQLCPKEKYDIKCPYSMEATRIVVHNTANDASAKNEITYMINNNNKVSFHFAVDDTEVRQGLPLNRNSWNAGDGANGKGNREGISIEICYSLSGGERFTKAEKLAAKFIAQLLDERKWGISKVTKHQDYNGKYCPHRTLDLGWNRFLNMVRNEMADKKPVTPDYGDYEVVVTLKGYISASDALAGKNPRCVVNPGKYYIYNKSGNAINVTKTKGVPGSWIDSTKNTSNKKDLATGTELSLKNVNLYSSSSSTRRSSTVTGTYYVWSSSVVNNRIRITRPYANVGKAGQVTGWISVDDAKAAIVTKSSSNKTETSNSSIKKGDKVRFKSSAKTYANGVKIPLWVKLRTLYVRGTPSNGKVVISIQQTGAITGEAYVADLNKV